MNRSNHSRVVLSAAISAAVLLVSCCSKPHKASDEVRFEPYSEQAFQAARNLSRPIVVFATAEWCGPCRSLHGGALMEKRVKAALEPLARLEIDCTDREDRTNAEIMSTLRIKGIPCLVFTDAQGTEVARIVGVGDDPEEQIIDAAKKAQGR